MKKRLINDKYEKNHNVIMRSRDAVLFLPAEVCRNDGTWQ
jgi:hypothetical protein